MRKKYRLSRLVVHEVILFLNKTHKKLLQVKNFSEFENTSYLNMDFCQSATMYSISGRKIFFTIGRLILGRSNLYVWFDQLIVPFQGFRRVISVLRNCTVYFIALPQNYDIFRLQVRKLLGIYLDQQFDIRSNHYLVKVLVLCKTKYILLLLGKYFRMSNESKRIYR